MISKKTVRMLWVIWLVLIAGGVLAQTNSQSYLDTIFSAIASSTHDTGAAAPIKPVYDTRTEKELLDEIHRLLSALAGKTSAVRPVAVKVVSIKDAVKVKRIPAATSSGNVITGSSATSIRGKTLPAPASQTVNAGTQKVVSPPPAAPVTTTGSSKVNTTTAPKKSTVSAEEAARRAVVSESKFRIWLIKARFGIDLEGGVTVKAAYGAWSR